MTLFEAAVSSVLKHEGGFVDHPDDPGGATNFGISQRSYPELDIKALTRQDAMRIYERDYWSQVPEHLADDVRWFAFDVCVHSGAGRMRALLNADATLLGLAANRLKFLAGLGTWEHFGKGWTRRVAGVLQDISQYIGEDTAAQRADTLVLHDFSALDALGLLFRRPVVLRGSFRWRERAGKVDVRRL